MQRERFSLMTLYMEPELRTRKMSVAEVLQTASAEGIPDIDVIGIKGKAIDAYRAAMAETGVGIYCYISYVSMFGNEASITKALDSTMKNAAALGAELNMIVPYLPIIDNRKARKHGREWTLHKLVEGFRIAVRKGVEYGLKVCFETTPQEDIRLSGIDDCRFVLENVPGLGLVFDTANMLPHGDETLAYYEALKDHIVHVHLKDVSLAEAKPSIFPDERTPDGRRMQCVAFGEGVIPVKEVYDRMIQDGYKGRFAIEYARPKNGLCSREEHLVHLKKHLAAIES